MVKWEVEWKRSTRLVTPIRLYHFEKAIQALESSKSRQRRDMEEASVDHAHGHGASFGLSTADDGTGGIVTLRVFE